MSSNQSPNSCYLSTNFDEHRWVMQIRRILEEVEDDLNDIHVTIFNVPKALRDTNPNAYVPQLVAFGPYHCWRSELQEMEKYKISSAKRIQNLYRGMKFHTIVDRFILLEHKIRACYHRYLDINSETLAWMMAIDSAFLLEVINIYGIKEGKTLTQVSPRMSHLVDYGRRKSAHNDILRDIIMLENQIPLLVLREMLVFSLQTPDIVDTKLTEILIGLCKDLSPFKRVNNWPSIQPSHCEHLLDFIYNMLVPTLEEIVDISEHIDQERKEGRKICKVFLQIKECLGRIPFKTILRLPWILISNLPGFAVLRAVFFQEQNRRGNLDTEIHFRPNQDDKLLLVEEIMIPSVVELSKSGVVFEPTYGGIMTTNFDKQSKKLCLPAISLDVNTEVLLRNLVAYEASCGLGQLVFARYTELMNGIIDTEDDARLLRERGIISNYLKSDEEVANLWNGMSKSLRLTRVPFLDEVIENVNKCYERNWKVTACKLVKAYMMHSWQFLAFLAAALILFLLMIQVLCNVLYCPNTAGTHTRGRL